MNKNNIKNLIIVLIRCVKNFSKTLVANIKKCFSCFVFLFRVVFSKTITLEKPEKDLNKIWPDKGNLPKVKVFEHLNVSVDLSIIIPMYNSEEYIVNCIESVLKQKTDFSYEIILVDDGSTDDTRLKIQKFLDSGVVKLIKQTNHGQSYSRNRAIEKASGRYIMMLDSDDLLLPDALQTMMRIAVEKNADIVEGTFKRFRNVFELENIEKAKLVLKKYSSTENPKFVLTSTGYSCGMVYKRELWSTLRYPEGYIFEDVITKFILRRKAKSAYKINIPVYAYRINDKSSSHKNLNLKHIDSIWVLPKIFSLCESEGAPFDGVFYLLALNHITILNYITVGRMSQEISQAAFYEMQIQLKSIYKYRPKHIPLAFFVLEQAVLKGRWDIWKDCSAMVVEYRMLKKWRER